MCDARARETIGYMEFQVEREMDGHWYSMGAPVEAESASKGVAICAVSEGPYRACLAAAPGARPEYFEVPSMGQPIQVLPR